MNQVQDTLTGNPLRFQTASLIRIAAGVTTIWLLVFPVTCVLGTGFLPTHILETITLYDYFIVSLGSLLISYLSLIPFAHASRTEKGTTERSRVASSEKSVASTGNLFLIGMTIRFVGTIALFVLCRYQMASADESIAAASIVWYVVLTASLTRAAARETSRLRIKAAR